MFESRSIQHDVMQFVSDLRYVGSFLRVTFRCQPSENDANL
jgi:hypothetical protein